MTVIKLNIRTKAGKAILELAKLLLSAKAKGVEIISENEEDSFYDKEFVKKIKKAESSNNRTRVTSKNLWENI
jgi:hypothetical protein